MIAPLNVNALLDKAVAGERLSPGEWLGGAIELADWSATQVDNRLGVTLIWKADVKLERSYTVYVHLLSEDGSLIAQLDRLPEGYPTSDWQAGEYPPGVLSAVGQ